MAEPKVRDTTLNIRGIDSDTVARLKRAAGARQWTLAEYIEALAELHAQLLKGATVKAALADTGLEVQQT